MRKKIFGLMIILLLCFVGCSKKDLKLHKEVKCLNNINDYLISDINTEEYITVVRDARYNEETKAFDVYGALSGSGACAYIKSTDKVDKIDIPGLYAEEPFLYQDGEFYGNGLNLNGTQDNIFPESAKVKSICIDDGYEYRLLRANSLYILDVRNKENDIRYSEKILNIDGIDKYIDDTKRIFLNSIKVYEKNIYIGGFSMDVVGNNKNYNPFIVVLNIEDYTLVNVITEIDIEALDEMLINETGKIIAVYYDSLADKTYVCDVDKNNTIEFDFYQKVVLYNDDSFVYIDNIGSVYEYDFEENKSNAIENLPEFKDHDTELNLVYYDTNGYIYIDYDDIYTNVAVSCLSNEVVVENEDTDNMFILEEENETYYAINYAGNKKIIFESEIYTNIKSMNFDEEYFYLSDDDTLYIYDYSGKLHFQKSFKNQTDIKCFGNSKQHYIATIHDKNKWKISSINVKEKEISEEYTTSIIENVEFIDGDSDYDFYMLADGILYGYNDKKNFTAIIDLSSCQFFGKIKGVNVSQDKIEIVSEYAITILKLRDNTSKENEVVKILVPASSTFKYKEILKKYETDNDNIDFIIESLDYTGITVTEDMPDIVIADSNTDIIHLLKMDIFEDVHKYISDNGLILPEFVDNIVNSYSEDKKMYVFPLAFSIEGINIMSHIPINKKTFCLDDLQLLIEENDYSVGYIPLVFLLDNNKKFINYSELNVDYKNDDFIKILEIMEKCLDNNSEYSVYDASLSYKSSKENFRFNNKNYYFVGVPSSDGNDYYVRSDDLFMISKNSENKSICLDILKFLLSEEVQAEVTEGWKFPVNKSLYQKYMNELAWGTDDEYAEEIINIIENTHNNYIANNRVKSILEEEMSRFESEAQNANETAESIQSRVTLYINEALKNN